MKILDGKKLSEEILRNLEKKIKKQHFKLRLAVVLVGANPVSQIYIRQKEKICKRIGIGFKLFTFSTNLKLPKLKREVVKISKNPSNSGIVIQLPLPKHIPAQEILNLIPPEKDVDVLSEPSLGRLYAGTLPILPPTSGGILRLLKKYKIQLEGKYIVVLGLGRLVGKPLTLQLFKTRATLSILNQLTKNIASFTQKADIIVSGVGKAGLIKGIMVKRGVVVVDAGTTVEGGKLRGDIDFESVAKKASYITPVPGGVGPMTVACLLENLVKLNMKNEP